VSLHYLNYAGRENDIFFPFFPQNSFESENGISRTEDGFLKNPESERPVQVMTGSYSYTGPDGRVSRKIANFNASLKQFFTSHLFVGNQEGIYFLRSIKTV
jgi:hypothetical protein